MFEAYEESPLIIAEIGVNHDGCLSVAKELLRAASSAGADAVKLQSFRTELCITRSSPLAGYQKAGGASQASQYELLKPLELSESDHWALKSLAEDLGLIFVSTPDDDWSIDLLLRLRTPFVKVASAEVCNHSFLRAIGGMRLPVILSTGMSTIDEVAHAVDFLQLAGSPEVALLHCTSAYPCPAEEANMLAITTMKKRFSNVIGFSDHTFGSEAGVMSIALGANIVEKHLTLDRARPGPDHAASSSPSEFAAYVRAVRRAAVMRGSGAKVPQRSELEMRSTLRRKAVAAAPLSAGHTLGREDVAFKRASKGLGPEQAEEFLGKVLRRALAVDEPICKEDLGDD